MNAEVEAEIQRLKQRYSNFGLLRFAAGWLLVVAIVGLFTKETLLSIIGIVVAIVVIVVANTSRRGATMKANALTEYLMFHTPEGQHAIREEAARRLREGDYPGGRLDSR